MKKVFLLSIIIIFASIFRYYGIANNLPYAIDIDEPLIMDKAVEVADGKLDHGVILRGSLPIYVNGFGIKLLTLLNPAVLKGHKSITDAYKIDFTYFYLIGRYISAFYAVLEILILFFLGRLLFGITVGLLASFFLSISSLSIQYSHLITPDTALSATLLLSVLITILAFYRNSHKLFLLSAFISGITLAQKFTAIIYLPIFLMLLISSRLFKGYNLDYKVLLLAKTLLLIFFAYRLSYPYFYSFDSVIEQYLFEFRTTNFEDLVINDIGLIGRIREYIFRYLHFGTGSFILLFSSFGIILSILKKSINTIFLSLFLLIFLIEISLPLSHHDRWVLPLTSFISLYAAYSFFELTKRIQNQLTRLILQSTLLTFISLSPLMRSVILTQSFKSPDTRIFEVEWTKKNNIDESKILRDAYKCKFS